MPSLSTYIDHTRQIWYVNIYWPAEDTRPADRKRVSLAVPASDDPAPALADFRSNALPALEAERLAAQPKPAENGKKPAGRTQGPLLRDLANWYLDTYLPYNRAAKKTIEYYQSTLWNFIGYCQTRHVARTGQLSARVVQEWQMHQIQHTTRESPSREQVLQVRRWLKVAEEHGEIPELPAIKWTIPPKQKGQQHKAHDRAVIDAWLDALCAWRPAAGLVARWVYATGWRIGDALDLRIDELDLERGIIDRAQLKTSSALDYPITPALRALLDQALKRHPKNPDARAHVFLNHKRQPWSYPQIYRLLQGYNKRGADITFRDLRKSFGTHLAMEGCPPNVLKELMGHGDIAMTLSYYVDVDLARMAQWSTRHTKTIAKTKTPVSAQVSKPKRPGK